MFTKFNLSFVVLMAVLVAPVSFGFQGDVAQPLPPIDTILQRVTEQALKEGDAERRFKQHYSYTRSKVTEYRNGEGKLKKREQRTRTKYPKPNTIASVSESSNTSSRTGDTTKGSEASTDGKAFTKSDFAMSPDMLSRFDYRLIRRELVNGRPTMVVDFKPADRDLPERNYKDKFINRAAGRVWVDEEDYALVKADVHLTDRVNVIGGLVGAVWKFNYGFERKRTDDGIWYARSINWHLEGREFFFRRTIDYHEENTNVRKVWQFDTAAK